ncbi:protein kinase [bacterium]|nr:protein kinase [candidate division CSSED10-310 bacterium]
MNPREWLGKRIREYHLTDIIGSGGMSAVFRAMHVKLQVERAVKVLRPDLTQDPEFVRRFEQEARILAVLEHPHLIRVFEFFEEQGFLFIVMEIAEGDSLEDLVLYHGVIPAKEMWTIVSQAAQGLAYAHKKGIIHRDLSPDNLIVAGYDEQAIRVKVIDFGIAKQEAIDPQSRKIMETGTTTSGSFLGKLRYCSPEQAMELPLDHRSDQYSLALIFLESVTGKPAFEGGSPLTMLMRRVNQPPPRLTDLVPGSAWPTEMERVLDRALQSSPSERFPTIVVFAESLGEAIGSIHREVEILNVAPATPPPRIVKKEPRLLELEEVASGDADDDWIPGLTSLAETMEVKPDRTIYPGTAPTPKSPRYGTVKPPPIKKRFPWGRVVFLTLIVAAGVLFFIVPSSRIQSIQSDIEEWMDSTAKKIDTLANREQPPTPTPLSIDLLLPDRPASGSGQGPYIAERSGVVAPRFTRTQPIDVPAHLRADFPPPVTVIVQAVVLKNGTLSQAIVMNSIHPTLDDMAIEAVKGYSFTGGTFRGEPADIIMDIPVAMQ